VVVTHAQGLVDALTASGGHPLCLVKEFGATTLEGLGPLEQPSWNWGSR
jgi:predicted ATPase